MAGKYEEFDKKLLREIAAGRSNFAQLCSALRADAVPFQLAPGSKTEAPVYRVVERRLQALRKRGVIFHSAARGGFWSLADPAQQGGSQAQ